MHLINILLHVSACSAALALGIMQLVLEKGDAPHSARGRWFLRAIAVGLAAAGLGAVIFRPDPTLAAVTFLVAYLCASGMRGLRRGAAPPSRADIAGAAVALICGGTLFWLARTGQAQFWKPQTTYPIAGALMFWGGLDVLLVVRGGWRSPPSVAVDHGARMTMAIGGLASAGAGTLLPQHAPWSQLLPSLAATLLVVGWIVGAAWAQRSAALDR